MALVLGYNPKQWQSTYEIDEAIFSAIHDGNGHVRTADLDRIFRIKQDVRSAITRLTKAGRIRRRRGFGRAGIEYFYHDVSSSSFRKYRKPEMDAFQNPRQ